MRSPVQSFSGIEIGRRAKACLHVDRGGGRSILRKQSVGYPLHVTRGFYLDDAKPDLLTLYLQSASGGLYAGDDLTMDVVVGQGAAFNLTTQAATVVHHGRSVGATQRQSIDVGEGAFCALTNDPYVLFPESGLELVTEAVVADSGVLLLVDGFSIHDPFARDGRFSSFAGSLTVTRPDGRVLLTDRGQVHGRDLTARGGPLGGMMAAATVTLIAPGGQRPGAGAWENEVSRSGCLVGVSPSPNDAGLSMRILGDGGGSLSRALTLAFQFCARAALGVDLAPRRK